MQDMHVGKPNHIKVRFVLGYFNGLEAKNKYK
jgi:hypothetical protein